MTCWSDLAYDMLGHITSFLPLTDHHRFSAVCKNWRLVAKQKRHSPAHQLPWLVLGDEPGTGKRKFYNLSEDRHYAIDIPELYGRYICGSSHGWLVAIDIKITGILINPFTREFYELPLFPQYNIGMWEATPPSYENFPIVDYREGPGGRGSGTFEELQVKIVHKAILSHDPKERADFTLMILTGWKGVPAFWKPGDSSWTVISVRSPMFISDVIYFKGQFVFATMESEVLRLNFQPDHPKMYEIESLRISQTCLIAQCYLVDYSGRLLLVERWFFEHYFKVLRVNFEKPKVSKRNHIRKAALFLGTNDSLVIDRSKLVRGCKCKTNNIYFTDSTRSFGHEVLGCDDMGVFNMSDKTVGTFYSPEIRYTRLDTPIWFTPNPW
ncbi:F-box protein [Carex littledalei]|uniref:F-box protein n=1 Tax=Carex littledalei TaxID=544730 RepID=A0A833RSP4_9POAL|nr:F-box protein [Carex littledalei]